MKQAWDVRGQPRVAHGLPGLRMGGLCLLCGLLMGSSTWVAHGYPVRNSKDNPCNMSEVTVSQAMCILDRLRDKACVVDVSHAQRDTPSRAFQWFLVSTRPILFEINKVLRASLIVDIAKMAFGSKIEL